MRIYEEINQHARELEGETVAKRIRLCSNEHAQPLVFDPDFPFA
jgi:hypothetical protein